MRKIRYAILTAVIVIAIIECLAVLAIDLKRNNEAYGNEQPLAEENVSKGEVEKKGLVELKEEPVEQREEQDREKQEEQNFSNKLFGINSNTVEMYSQALDPEAYRKYDTGIEDVSFYYPTTLYNKVTVDKSVWTDSYGENIQTVTFEGSKGSILMYRIIKRNTFNSSSLEDAMDYVYQTEKESMVEPQDILYLTEPTYGKIIVTGWDTFAHKNAIYDLLKIEDAYILQMKAVFPNYISEEDKNEKGYVIECCYRLCSFSGSKLPYRTYAEYLEANVE